MPDDDRKMEAAKPKPDEASTIATEPKPKRRSRTARSEEERREKLQAILDAAFEVFSAKGYAATRLDEVAARAGVGKGTIYLYVSSKQELFEAMIRNSFTSSFDMLEMATMAEGLSVEQLISIFLEWFSVEVIATRRREILWLILREANQFPELAKAHHTLIVSRVLTMLRARSERAVASGEIAHDEISRFPQLAIAPALIAIMWMELFRDIEPLDVGEMMNAHRDLLLRGLKGNAS